MEKKENKREIISKAIAILITAVSLIIVYMQTHFLIIKQFIMILGILLLVYVATLSIPEEYSRYNWLISFSVMLIMLGYLYAETKNVLIEEVLSFLTALMVSWLIAYLFKGVRRD